MSQVSFVEGFFPDGPHIYSEPFFEKGFVATSSQPNSDLVFLGLQRWFFFFFFIIFLFQTSS
jgi:hypothetical protein